MEENQNTQETQGFTDKPVPKNYMELAEQSMVQTFIAETNHSLQNAGNLARGINTMSSAVIEHNIENILRVPNNIQESANEARAGHSPTQARTSNETFMNLAEVKAITDFVKSS